MASVIAIDASDMDSLRRRLREASAEVDDCVPALPGAAAFGPAILAGAAHSFESAMRRSASSLHTQWTTLDSDVEATLADMQRVEEEIISAIERLQGAFA